jgi:hypothetical protein
MDDHSHLRVRLLADGRIGLPVRGGADALPEATWEMLGTVQQGGHRMGFVRAEISGASWVTWVRSDRLDQRDREPLVTLERQTIESSSPLAGWILFC